jgi:hypothetical protein
MLSAERKKGKKKLQSRILQPAKLSFRYLCAGGVAQGIQFLLRKHMALSSNQR